VAIKRMDNIFDDETDCKRILREITLLRQLKHPCVVEVIDVCQPKDQKNFTSLYIVLEYADSDLKKILKSSLNLDFLHIQTIVYNLLCAIKYLHESKVLHRDIKPANILVNEDCSVKLCDYGLARSISNVESHEMFIRNEGNQEDEKMDSCSSKISMTSYPTVSISNTS
jgi:mitogen-activated protein kinase 1/3